MHRGKAGVLPSAPSAQTTMNRTASASSPRTWKMASSTPAMPFWRLTTSFYDVQRAGGGRLLSSTRNTIAIIGQGPANSLPYDALKPAAQITVGIATGAGCLDLTLDEAGIGGAWAWLDVWPASNWLTAPPHAHRHAQEGLRLSHQPPVLAAGFHAQTPASAGNGKRGEITAFLARLCPQNTEDAPQISLLLQHFRADGRDMRGPACRRDCSGEPRTPAGSGAANAGARRPSGAPPGPRVLPAGGRRRFPRGYGGMFHCLKS